MLTRLIKYWQIDAPITVTRPSHKLSKTYERNIFRSARLSDKSKSYLLQALIAFLGIALATAADKVFPSCRTAEPLRYHMIYCKIPARLSTILADVIISGKNASARQFQLWHWSVDLIFEPHNRRRMKLTFSSANYFVVRMKYVNLPKIDERYRPL